MKHTARYVHGAYRPGTENALFDVMNFATEETIASAEIEDADAALDAAEIAMKDWAA